MEARLAAWFHDPHTLVYLIANASWLRELPVDFYWVSDGLVTVRTSESPSAVRTGDRVVAISGVTPSEIDKRLAALLAEETPARRSVAASLLPFSTVLQAVGAVEGNGTVALTLQGAGGGTSTVTLDFGPVRRQPLTAPAERFQNRYLVPSGLFQRGQSGSFWTWEVTPRYGFFLLDQCNLTAGYTAAVNAFFRTVAAQHTPVVVLDLQENGGGDSDVADAWLEHLPAKYKLSDWRMGTMYGSAALLPQKAPIFNGKVYVLQSGMTFSSAMWFADALTGPGLGARVGTAIGEPTAGYGNVKQYVTPEFHVPFQVSQVFFPPPKGPPQPDLPAQVQLPVTVADVQQGVNPVAHWLGTLP